MLLIIKTDCLITSLSILFSVAVSALCRYKYVYEQNFQPIEA